MRPITEGWKLFQDSLSFGENRRHGEAKPESSIEPGRSDMEELANKKGWDLPVNFCADCGNVEVVMEEDEHDRRKGGGTVFILEPHEGNRQDLGIKPGDFITAYFCFPCTQTKPPSILISDDDDDITDMDSDDAPTVWSVARKKRRWQNVQDWVRAARLRGEEPAEFDGSGRVVRAQGVPMTHE